MVKWEPIFEDEINDGNNDNSRSLGPFTCPHCSNFFNYEEEFAHHYCQELSPTMPRIESLYELHNPQFSPPSPHFPFSPNAFKGKLINTSHFHNIFGLDRLIHIGATTIEVCNPYDHSIRRYPYDASNTQEFNFHETMDFLSAMDQRPAIAATGLALAPPALAPTTDSMKNESVELNLELKL